MRIKDKGENYSRVDEVLAEMLAALPEDYLERKGEAKKFFKGLQEKVLRDEVLERSVRLDGRKFDEVRPIWIEIERAPARPRLGGVHPRRDAGAGHLHARHRRRPAEDRARSTARCGSASCSTTTSRPSRSAKCSSCAAPAAAKSATARSPNARWRR